jgi:hypothetical protein
LRSGFDVAGRDTGGVIYTIDVRWACGQPAHADAEHAFGAAFRPHDDDICVWLDEEDPSTLRVEFDVDADDYGLAIQRALREVRLAASSAGLSGGPTEVTAMTEEGQSRWSE